MNRYKSVNNKEVLDTETDHKLMLWDTFSSQFISMADDVAAGLNLVYTVKMRRGSVSQMTKQEFIAFKSTILETLRQAPDNKLAKDILKLCDLISGGEVTFGK